MSFLEKQWHQKSPWLILLWPLTIVFRVLTLLRRKLQQTNSRPASHTAPVIVVGNISVGGTGKTPLLMSLAALLKAEGYSPGIISRGYGGETASYPLVVDADTPVAQSGDEALLIALTTQCPVVVDPDREQALQKLLEDGSVDVVLSDDGLQHYKLHRDIEIAVVDGQRLFSNGLCLPAGPLRESISRLQQVDYVVINGEPSQQMAELNDACVMSLEPKFLVNMVSGERRPFGGAPFKMGNKLQAVTALGNPQRFYRLLEMLPYEVERHTYPDHHPFVESDFKEGVLDARQPVVMTEKDAVKCRDFATANFWTLSVAVNLDPAFTAKLLAQLATLKPTFSSTPNSTK